MLVFGFILVFMIQLFDISVIGFVSFFEVCRCVGDDTFKPVSPSMHSAKEFMVLLLSVSLLTFVGGDEGNDGHHIQHSGDKNRTS